MCARGWGRWVGSNKVVELKKNKEMAKLFCFYHSVFCKQWVSDLVSFSESFPAFGVVTTFYFSSSYNWVLIICGLNLHFPND